MEELNIYSKLSDESILEHIRIYEKELGSAITDAFFSVIETNLSMALVEAQNRGIL